MAGIEIDSAVDKAVGQGEPCWSWVTRDWENETKSPSRALDFSSSIGSIALVMLAKWSPTASR